MPWRSVVAIAFLCGLGFLILSQLQRLERAGRAQQQVTLPDIDYALRDVQLSLMDAESKSRIDLQAEKIEHMRKSDELVLAKPTIQRFGKAGEPAIESQTLTAASARVYQKGQSVLLYGGVEMQSRGQSDADMPLVLTTDSMWLFPAEKRAESSQSVQIQRDQTTLSGRGFSADFAAQSLELTQDVNARVFPKR